MTEESSPIAFEINVKRLPSRGMPVRFHADASQKDALARAHGLLSVESLDVDLLVQSWRRDGVKVTGRVEAEIVQACVVSLEPVPSTVSEMVEATFVPEGSKLAKPTSDAGGEILLSADGPDAPDIFPGEAIDVGALAEQFFGLGIDPYPRSVGAGDGLHGSGPETQLDGRSPFAGLKSLIDKD